MPIYVYRCQKCGAREEHLQRISDPPMTECERCGGRLEKEVTSAAFHLKGGGWYKDGYASAKPSDSGGSGESSSSEGPSAATTESGSSGGSSDGAGSKKKDKGKDK